MNNYLILKIHNQGEHYPVTLFFATANGQMNALNGELPPIPQDVINLSQKIKTNYAQLDARVSLSAQQPSHLLSFPKTLKERLNKLKEDTDSLKKAINKWLNAETSQWKPIKQLLENFSQDPQCSTTLLLECQVQVLREVPLEQWDLLQKENFQIAYYFEREQFQFPKIPQFSFESDISQVLGIFSSSENDLSFDEEKRLWLQFSQAFKSKHQSTFWTNPTRRKFQYLWRKKCDILYFGGHSQTEINEAGQYQGKWQINPEEEITIAELAKTLEKANQKGLKLVIFNSCDGWGLADDLAQLKIDNLLIIFMRYPIPDCVAPRFLDYFLGSLKETSCIFKSLNQAQAQLAEVSEFPLLLNSDKTIQLHGIDFIPTIALISSPEKPEPDLPNFNLFKRIAIFLSFSLLTSLLIVLLRSLGLFQEVELKTFNLLLKIRPNEGVDPRLLLVTITNDDVKAQPSQERGAASLSDVTLNKLHYKLKESKAVVIGLDIYRDNPVEPQFPDLAQWMKNSDRLIGICMYGETPPPPEVSSGRQGFNNILTDVDGKIRRHLLAVESSEPCQNPYAFSLHLARRYLAQKRPNIDFTAKNQRNYIQIGSQELKPLTSSSGGYHRLDDRGHQIMINYRKTDKIAETVNLMKFLNDYPVDQIGERIVIIGTVAPSFNDHNWETPIGYMSGVEVQAHLVSDLLSTVLEKRSLIWFFPEITEEILIIVISFGGGAIALVSISRSRKILLGLGTGTMIISFTWLSFQLWGLWLPIVPLLASFIGAVWVTHLILKKGD